MSATERILAWKAVGEARARYQAACNMVAEPCPSHPGSDARCRCRAVDVMKAFEQLGEAMQRWWWAT